MDIFAEKTVVVTGAASGVGKALSEELAARGAYVVLADINAEPLEEATTAIVDAGCSAKAAVLDVTDFEAVKELVDDTAVEYGQLDYVFNNAGVLIGGEAQDYTCADWHRAIDIDLYGVVHGVAAAYPKMVRQGSGHIVNTSSFSGMWPSPLQAAYVTSKYGVVGLSEALRLEGKLHGVKVSVVCPGFIRTGLYDNIRLIGFEYDKLARMMPKGVLPGEAARSILRGVERNQAVILVPRWLIVPWLLQRLSPGLVRWIFGLVTRFVVRTSKSEI